VTTGPEQSGGSTVPICRSSARLPVRPFHLTYSGLFINETGAFPGGRGQVTASTRNIFAGSALIFLVAAGDGLELTIAGTCFFPRTRNLKKLRTFRWCERDLQWPPLPARFSVILLEPIKSSNQWNRRTFPSSRPGDGATYDDIAGSSFILRQQLTVASLPNAELLFRGRKTRQENRSYHLRFPHVDLQFPSGTSMVCPLDRSEPLFNGRHRLQPLAFDRQ